MALRLTYQPWGETLAELIDAGRRAERAGAETLWVSELYRSAACTAAALAAGTENARVGTSIVLAFTRSPMITALEALDLDELSGGRFVLGVGSGVQRLNEEWHNVTFGKPVVHVRETVRNIRLFWQQCTSGDPMIVEGEWEPMRIHGYQRPFAVANPNIPIFLAAMGPQMTRLAGEIGDGWISHELCSPEYLSQKILPDLHVGINRSERRTRADLEVVVSACCSIAENAAFARRRAAGLVGFYATVRTYANFFEFHGLAKDQQRVIDEFRTGAGAAHLADSVSGSMIDALTLSGRRDDVAERIAAYDGIADAVKLSPPTNGLSAGDIRDAQDEVIAMLGELTGAR